MVKEDADQKIVPTHVGFIVDGNRRWARERGLPTLQGHDQGAQRLKAVLSELLDNGVKYVSVFIFSTENWKRTKEEVSYLLDLVFKFVTRELDEVIAKGVRIRFLGTEEGLSRKLIKTLRECEAKSAHCTRGTLAVCFNYGGQTEIADAVKSLLQAGVSPEDVTPEAIRRHLYVPDIPDIDIIVRTSGEQRLSNFMLWRAAYSELMFIDKYWPDMTKEDASVIIKEYSRRQRRFGV